MQTKLLFLTMLTAVNTALLAQETSPLLGNNFAFFEYGIKDGHEASFVNGYKRDLEWHQANKDTWAWVGWFITNGPRRGRFVDATPHHHWQDFDNWVINRVENAKHNEIHYTSHTENPSGQYRIVLPEYSTFQADWYQSPMLHLYYFELNIGHEKTFQEFILYFKKAFLKTNPTQQMVWMKTVSGDRLPQFVLFIPMGKNEDLRLSEAFVEPLLSTALPDKEAREALQKLSAAVKNMSSEIWNYRQDLSLYPGK